MTKTQHLIFSLYQIGAIQFGEFKLKSGQMSSIYINLRKIISYPDILRSVADAMWQAVHQCEFTLICGVPYTALPIATCISLEHHIPMIMRRKEKKDYGTKQIVEGEFQPGQCCLIIEDIITTGSSILETTKDLEEAGLQVRDIIALIDREQGGKENLAQKYHLHTLFTLSEILNTLKNSLLLNSTERHLVEQLLEESSSQ
jgi:orotate phosphoribosyltransferase